MALPDKQLGKKIGPKDLSSVTQLEAVADSVVDADGVGFRFRLRFEFEFGLVKFKANTTRN